MVSTSSAPSKAGGSSFLRLALSGEAGLILLAWGLGRWWHISPVQYLRLTPGSLVWGAAATFPLVVGLAWMLRSPRRSIRRLVELVVDHVGPLLDGHSLLTLAALATVAGVSEELLFRGVLQPGLGRWLGDGAALLLTSVLFGLVHFASRTYAIFALLMGLYLGALFLLAGNLVAPMVTHAAYDFVALVWVARRYSLSDTSPSPT